jgi:hypothetical protein
MLNKFLVLIILVSLNNWFLQGQTIHYNYDNSGNRLIRYIILQKSFNILSQNSLKESTENTTENTTENIKQDDFEDKLGEMTVKIYPNPTQGVLLVEVSGLVTDETVNYQLFSQTGILLDANNQVNYPFSIDLSKYPKGLYILKLMTKEKKSVWKILKE